MGLETAVILKGISTAASIVSGIQQFSQANKQSKRAQEEAEARAREEARANIEFEGRQKLAFLKSGVSLEGSPLLVLADTRERGQQNIQNIIDSGEARASAIRGAGRNALFGGFAQGLGTAAGADFFSSGSATPPIPQPKPMIRPLRNTLQRL